MFKDPVLNPVERTLKAFLRVLAVLYGLLVLGSLAGLLGWSPRFLDIEPGWAAWLFVVSAALGAAASLASADVRRQQALIGVMSTAHAALGLAGLVLSLQNPAGWLAMLIALPVLIAVLLWALKAEGERRTLNLRYLSPLQFRCLEALAEVVIAGRIEDEEQEVVPADDVAYNVDRYLASFRARNKWIAKMALLGIEIYPLLSFKPFFSQLDAEERLAFIKSRFYQDVTLRLVPRFWRALVQAMIRMAKQLCYLGYYSDPRSFPQVGYLPFPERPHATERLRASPPKISKPLNVIEPARVDSEVISGQVVIIGSGAGGSIVAHGLASRGIPVILLERGPYIPPQEFTANEVEMLGKLYADGALQLSRDFGFQVLQGSCVGGTTVVNNAVSFRMPRHILDRWNDPQGIAANLDPFRLNSSFDATGMLMKIGSQSGVPLNPGGDRFMAGIHRLGLDQHPNRFGVVDANIEGCVGCGYCNLGCSYGKKLSMLDRVLPEIQENGSPARIYSECEAVKFLGSGEQVRAVRCRLSNGRTIEVHGDCFVVAAGPISSSLLLQRSGLGGRFAGEFLSFNLGSPVTAVFSEDLNSHEGLQISHYLELEPPRGFIIETWFNPPVSQALAMPGWFEDHFKNMLRYPRTTSVGILVGTQSNGRVRPQGLTGRDIDYSPTPEDFKTLREGMALTGRILLAGGAVVVMPHTFRYQEFKDPGAWEDFLDGAVDSSDFTLGTGHPQGGNILSGKRELGVINPEFRLWDAKNVFVTDASVFPTSIGVNPQWTVMSLAHYATDFIAQACSGRNSSGRFES